MITFTDGSTTRYTYDATGRKLRVEHKVMTTGVFNPGQELLDDAGVLDEPGVEMPAPDFPGLNGPAAVMMPQEMEQAAPPAISDAEEASGSPKRPRSTGDAPAEYLPYELTVTDYCGNYVYENGKLSRILFDGGYITFPDTTVNEVTIANINKPQYHYYFTDHLGSVRVVTDAQGNIEQTNNYYPYGGLMASSSTIANPVSQANVGANQPNRYNGKELDRKNGLDWLDYGARHFAGHGQWTSLDPLAEKYYDWSPYVYCIGNPMKYVDPDGRQIKPGDFFRTANAAALDFGMFYNDNSIREDREMLSYIVKVKNEKGEIGYTYTPAFKGGKHSVRFPKNISKNVVAIVHTHGAYDNDSWNDEFSGIRDRNENIIVQNQRKKVLRHDNDLGIANSLKIDMFLASPNGVLQKYRYSDNNISVISKELPSDVNHPNRENNNNANIERQKITIRNSYVMMLNILKLLSNGTK